MIVRISFLASLLVISTLAFECSPDTILRMATNKREKQLERECHEQKTGQDICETKDELEKSWKDFQEVSDKYKEAVSECRKYVEEKSRPKRTVEFPEEKLYDEKGPALPIETIYETVDEKDTPIGEHHNHKHHKNTFRRSQQLNTNGDKESNEPHADHTGHNHRVKRSTDDDPNDTTIDHTGHNHRRRRSGDHDPNDPNVDHTGHNHRRRRHNDDPNDTTIDHTGHNHRHRRSGEHDPNDPNIDHTGHNHRHRRHNDDPNDTTIDHTGHNHRMRRSHNDDPNDTTIDHTGHNHRLRRSGDHDPSDPNIDHTGHNHRRRRHHVSSRIRRTVCSTAGQDQLSAMSSKFLKHCERENICLPEEDLPKGKQQDDILALQKLRAKKYSEYLTQVSKCYGKL